MTGPGELWQKERIAAERAEERAKQGARWEPARERQAQRVIEACAEVFDVPTELLRSTDRREDPTLARQLAAYLMRTRLRLSYPAIARVMGWRDHGTALYNVKRAKTYLEGGPSRQADAFGAHWQGHVQRRLNAVEARLVKEEK